MKEVFEIEKVFNDISLVSNDYLSFVYDYGYHIKLSSIDKDRRNLRFFISSGNSKKTFGDLKWDLIPFYEYLLNNYSVGVEGVFSKDPTETRYSTLQLTKGDEPFYNPALVKLGKRDLLNKDLSEYDDCFLGCISFYIDLENEEWLKDKELDNLLDNFNESRI